ncbi:hypothetical protein [Bailinhaonella thermotolerans]|uniref:hypothetical protein n=1 Tax=Bailinhaonella thermotolerans TaxID=1070861 RepID=UPI00192A432B|nr:hypothetical protein [Bailinhaonella thermotolerans]
MPPRRSPAAAPQACCPSCHGALDGGPVLYGCATCHRSLYAADLDVEFRPRPCPRPVR